jgi:uncharacterized protein YcbK (DUF882 family)
MTAISHHFDLDEFRCPCCGRVAVQPPFIAALQSLRDAVGPITVTSGFRCAEHNAQVGGVGFSSHLVGMAADIVCAGLAPEQLAAFAERVSFERGGIGIYPVQGHVHVDLPFYGGPPRPARWRK